MVDDEEAIVSSIQALLETLGYQVRTFTRSDAAWEAFVRNPDDVDAVVTDYTMPHMTGIELTRKIRGFRPDIPIVICSGYLSFREKLAGLERVVLLKKPISIYELAHTLRRVFDHQIETARPLPRE